MPYIRFPVDTRHSVITFDDIGCCRCSVGFHQLFADALKNCVQYKTLGNVVYVNPLTGYWFEIKFQFKRNKNCWR